MDSSGDRSATPQGMGSPARASPRLCRLLLPGGIFLLLLLYFSSLHLQLPRSACARGGRPCLWFGDLAPEEEERRQVLPPSPPVQTPGLLLLQRARPRCRAQQFQIQHLQSAFAASIAPRGDILIGEYLHGWNELIKFMDTLGTAFGLISRETQSKMTIMQNYQSGQHGAHYHSLQSMVAFELARGLVDFHTAPTAHPPSGCRTLLRLHRALKWLELFLYKLGTSEGGDPSQMCASAYQEALAPYHSWWVRQAASLAFMAMPAQQELYSSLCVEKEQDARAILLATVHTIIQVYNSTQEVFSVHQMLELP